MLRWLLFGFGIWAGLILSVSCGLGILAFAVSCLNKKMPKTQK